MNSFREGPRSYDCYLDKKDMQDLRKTSKDWTHIDDTWRCFVKTEDDTHYLKSYWTVVASIKDGVLHRHWDDWSATTSKHIKKFCNMFNVEAPCKKAWEAMTVEEI